MLPNEYLFLFNAITDALRSLEDLTARLRLAQSVAEELFIESAEEPDQSI